MKKKGRNRKKQSVFVPIVLLAIIVILVIIIFIFELNGLKDNSSSQSITTNNTQVENDVSEVTEKTDEIGEALSFDTFLKETYSQEEIEQFSSKEINDILDDQINYGDVQVISFRKIAGSVKDESALKSCVHKSFDDDQYINTVEVVEETNLYYIVKVDWDYINNGVTNNHNEEILVFKSFYYDAENYIFNMDDINVVKQIIDIDYYVQNYKNSGKRLIQSFINESGKTTQYVIYYFDIDYGDDESNEIITLVKETVNIDSATGEIEGTEKTNIKENIVRK